MSRLVISLVRGSVRTAYGAARHPIATTSQAVGLATEAVKLGVGVVQGRIPGSPPEPQPSAPRQRPAEAPTEEPTQAPAKTATETPTEPRSQRRSGTAGTDARAGAPVEPVTQAPGEPGSSGPVRIPSPDEVAVRATGPAPGQPGEAFATEPKVASRDVEHGGSATADREAVEGFLDEMEAGEPESPVEAIGTTTGAEPGEEAAVLAESETLRRAAERDPEA